MAKFHTRSVIKECHNCQANDRPRNKLGPIVYTPIPPTIMSHVAIDVFNMPTQKVDGRTYDCVVVCVCRHSGWLVAVPEFTSGLRADKVADAMIKSWSAMGIPTKITSDRGPQFHNAWWKTMCAHFCITHIYSQPYHHQANGRVERAGQQLIEVLRKLTTESDQGWVNILPRALNMFHDCPWGEWVLPVRNFVRA